jgi:hypothetical protein
LPELAGEHEGFGSTLHSYTCGNSPLSMIDPTDAYRRYTTDELG